MRKSSSPPVEVVNVEGGGGGGEKDVFDRGPHGREWLDGRGKAPPGGDPTRRRRRAHDTREIRVANTARARPSAAHAGPRDAAPASPPPTPAPTPSPPPPPPPPSPPTVRGFFALTHVYKWVYV